VRFFVLLVMVLSMLCANLGFAERSLVEQRSDVRQFIDMMVTRYHFNRVELTKWFNSIKTVPENTKIKKKRPVLTRMHHQKAFDPWYEYRNFFLNETRTKLGVQYWIKHRAILERVNKQYGVPQSIVLATIGLESKYGLQMGGFPVFKALAVLAFDYPKRKAFFTQELIAYLLYCKQNAIAPLSIKGSYAGAIGQPQFMPSNIKRYGVDFEHDGKIDLVNSPADIAASVSNFYLKNHYQPSKPIAITATIKGDAYLKLVKAHRTFKQPLSLFEKNGVMPTQAVKDKNVYATLLILQDKGHKEYWLAFHNFYVIKNYNNSTNYAMSIFQLSLRIKKEYHEHLAKEIQKQKAKKAKALKKLNKAKQKVTKNPMAKPQPSKPTKAAA
jgi:membrane-bound lytic murein transglycosylase B